MTKQEAIRAPIEEQQRYKTILVVEDDDCIGSLVVEALSMETPHRALLVSDAHQALKTVRGIKPNLFITDYRLPSMDGIELCDRLRATEALKNTPVILMSAYLPEQEVRKRELVGLQKPFELDELINTVERLLA